MTALVHHAVHEARCLNHFTNLPWHRQFSFVQGAGSDDEDFVLFKAFSYLNPLSPSRYVWWLRKRNGFSVLSAQLLLQTKHKQNISWALWFPRLGNRRQNQTWQIKADCYLTKLLLLSGENIPGGLLMHGNTHASLHKHPCPSPNNWSISK